MAVPPGGYAWWYLDALSDDGARGLTIIAFLGSVFSPYYAHARHRATRTNDRRGADPLDHCALNVALYGGGQSRWSMTERTRGDVERDPSHLRIGPARLEWTADGLVIHVDERCAPWPRRIRGTITVAVRSPATYRSTLDERGRHRWGIIAPHARVDVALDAPHCAWSGSAYLDSNRGDVPLEDDFVRWDWSRAHLPDDRTAVVYDIERVDGSARTIAERFTADGSNEAFEAPATTALPTTAWRLDRSTRSDPGPVPTVVRSLEDGPFYSRTVVAARWDGEAVTMVHEHLDLARFGQRWVRALLPFRMPRRF